MTEILCWILFSFNFTYALGDVVWYLYQNFLEKLFLLTVSYYDYSKSKCKSFLNSSVQSLSLVWLFGTPWISACQASLSITNSDSCLSSWWCLPAISSSVVPFSSCPQSLPASWSFPTSQLFAWGGPKYWSFSFSISPSNEHPGLIPFRMDWLDLLALQGTLKSLLQHHRSKASIFQRSAFFTVQLSHPYMSTGKTIALTRRTFVGKVMSSF